MKIRCWGVRGSFAMCGREFLRYGGNTTSVELVTDAGERLLIDLGTGATELVHIGQAVMGCGGSIDYLVDAVFNYPTLAESYKVAALDAVNKMRHIDRLHG